jgi:alpha-1,3/alpha-1,6-mannosyltransferase
VLPVLIYLVEYSDRPTFISLNRFEAKKNIALAVNAFSLFLSNLKSTKNPGANPNLSTTRLVLAGGYDPRVQENIDVLKSLITLASSLKLSWAIISRTPLDIPEGISGEVKPSAAQVIFLPNFTTTQRSILLKSASTMALLYTPHNEHFGIVPVEAMACGLPVLACKSGGPKESVVDPDDQESPINSASGDIGGEWSVLDPPKPSSSSTAEQKTTRTGYLRPPDPVQWAQVLFTISTLSHTSGQYISRAACSRAKEYFSMDAMSRGMERALEDAYRLGPINGKYGMQMEAIMGVLVWGYVFAVIVSLWLFGGTFTIGWTAVLLLGSTALGAVR